MTPASSIETASSSTRRSANHGPIVSRCARSVSGPTSQTVMTSAITPASSDSRVIHLSHDGPLPPYVFGRRTSSPDDQTVLDLPDALDLPHRVLDDVDRRR